MCRHCPGATAYPCARRRSIPNLRIRLSHPRLSPSLPELPWRGFFLAWQLSHGRIDRASRVPVTSFSYSAEKFFPIARRALATSALVSLSPAGCPRLLRDYPVRHERRSKQVLRSLSLRTATWHAASCQRRHSPAIRGRSSSASPTRIRPAHARSPRPYRLPNLASAPTALIHWGGRHRSLTARVPRTPRSRRAPYPVRSPERKPVRLNHRYGRQKNPR